MELEERVKLLETEFRATRDELKQILLELRVYLMEAQTPLPSGNEAHLHGTDPERGVTPNGNRQES